MRNLLTFLIILYVCSSATFAKGSDSSGRGLHIYLSTAVFSSSNQHINEKFSGSMFFSPVIALSFNNHFSPFAEYAYVSGKVDSFPDDKQNFSFRQNFISVGLMNKVQIAPKLVFNVKYGLSSLIMSNSNMILSNSRLGFIGGASFESYITEVFSVNIGASYIYQSKNNGGFRIEPGIHIKL
ncbi:MAG: hypothetical protein ACXWW0_09295 [Bacteroidia bacterium]